MPERLKWYVYHARRYTSVLLYLYLLLYIKCVAIFCCYKYLLCLAFFASNVFFEFCSLAFCVLAVNVIAPSDVPMCGIAYDVSGTFSMITS